MLKWSKALGRMCTRCRALLLAGGALRRRMKMSLPSRATLKLGWSLASSFMKGMMEGKYEAQENRAKLSTSSIHGPQSSPFWARPFLLFLTLFYTFPLHPWLLLAPAPILICAWTCVYINTLEILWCYIVFVYILNMYVYICVCVCVCIKVDYGTHSFSYFFFHSALHFFHVVEEQYFTFTCSFSSDGHSDGSDGRPHSIIVRSACSGVRQPGIISIYQLCELSPSINLPIPQCSHF